MAKKDEVVTVVPPQEPVLTDLPTGGNADGEPVDPTDSRATSAKRVAQAVAAGQWGRGNKRLERLKAAGHDPKEVMVEYNKIFGR